VYKCSSGAIWLLCGRAGANDPGQATTDHVFKNCPTHVSSPKINWSEINWITSTSSLLTQTQCQHIQNCVHSVLKNPKTPSGTIRFGLDANQHLNKSWMLTARMFWDCVSQWFCCSWIENERNHRKYKDKQMLSKWIWWDFLKCNKTRGFLTNRNCPMRVADHPGITPARPRENHDVELSSVCWVHSKGFNNYLRVCPTTIKIRAYTTRAGMAGKEGRAGQA